MAWGLEARVPFLDKAFLEVAMNIDPTEKQFSKGSQRQLDADGRPRMEKVLPPPDATSRSSLQYILRKAFDVGPLGQTPYLPDDILWRQKEQFSDGVGYSWIDGLKAHAEASVSDAKLADASSRYPVDTPDTKEAYMIREMFESWFPSEAAASTAVRWIPRADWGCAADRASIAVRLADVCSFWSGGRDSRRGAAGQAIDARDHSLVRRARYAVADYATGTRLDRGTPGRRRRQILLR